MDNNKTSVMDLPFDKGNQLTYVRRGVLWVQKNPHYIVELVKEPDFTYVMVYAVHPDSKDKPKKLAIQQEVGANPRFSTQTVLGKIANQLFPPKKKLKWVVKDPLFTAPVIPNRVATLTGQQEDGFFEREPDRITQHQGGKKFVRGKNTGVFIGLSSIIWEDKVTIPTASLIKTINNYRETLFYDFEGDNQSHPLARYYKEDLEE
ncbi:hypothetical protein BH753_gp173 [Bacillus phage Shbh1]|uniref:Uncharacterized protein n=1 Tax=Bacillus phage Shbh1 TaxID=1796992 RepID=A0A142F1J8_9CAUD|nr:hypothetical protein BH753_gp173 [Bacillus phage Shbh1]AMQ66655.1 hypothetical protein [Bacillus phage Shbh1]